MENFFDQIIELAQEVEKKNPIDWDNLPFDQNTTYRMLTSGVLETLELNDTFSRREIVLLASCIHLTVENFILSFQNEQVDTISK